MMMHYIHIYAQSCVYLQAVNRPRRTHSQLALDHFDMFYQPVFGKKWPSIRIALLTTQKYCALVNHFAELETILKLQQLGAGNVADLVRKRVDIFNRSTEKTIHKGREDYSKMEAIRTENTQCNKHTLENQNWHKTYNITNDKETFVNVENQKDKFNDDHNSSTRTNVERDLLSEDSDLYTFVPADKVYSEPELLLQEEIKQSTFTLSDVPINVMPDQISVPADLKFFVYPKGETKDFPTPQPDKAGLLGRNI